MSVKFIGDMHLGHKNICKYRPQFATTEEHDEHVKEQILTSVSKRDTLWLMGDNIFSLEAFNRARKLLGWCNIKVILGNHDTETRDRQVILHNMIDHFDIGIHSLVKYKRKGDKKAWLTHAPIHESEFRGAFVNIHGHVHWKSVRFDTGDLDRRYCNVSCENVDYKPVSFEDIEKGFR